MRVLVLDNQKQPLMPCSPARARQLLRDGKAAVFRRYPFTIILKERQSGETQPVSLNVDPGSKTTGIALVALFQRGHTAIYGQHIIHRGQQIRDALESRRAIRRSRRHRKTRYRQPRFLNRNKPKGWLPPSLLSRVHNVETWTKRLNRFVPVTLANVETVRFDMQLMENPDIAGKDYQQGSLFGWELREYLLYRHQHICAYCYGLTKDAVLEKEHIIPKALGGSNRLANHVISCRECNEDKGKLHPNAWSTLCQQRGDKLNLARAKNMQRIMAGYRPSLKDAAVVNATRYAVGNRIKSINPETQFWSGGLTKKNRSEQQHPKDHWIDAACIGHNGSAVSLECKNILVASAKGHGSRQMCRVDKYGFPRTSAKSHSVVKGFKTGDLVIANVPTGKKQGKHVGRVAVRKSSSFNVQTENGAVQGISYKHCRITQRSDGYNFNYGAAIPPGSTGSPCRRTMNEHLERLKSIISKSAFNVSPRYSVNVDFKKIFVPDTGILLYNLNVSEAANEQNLSPEEILTRMTPAFQRENTKWTQQMQVTFVENLLSGCETKIHFFDLSSAEHDMDNCMVLDGLQRLTAIAAFQQGQFPVFGDLYWDMVKSGGIFPRLNLLLNIYQFESDKEACEFYIQMNKGITHSEDDLKTAYTFLDAL